jgi:CheY-like chemotaxis protein
VTQLLDVMFGQEGWRVEVVTSGEACLDVLDRRIPDVIVLDQEMAGLTGLQTAATARKRGIDRPILLFSAYLDAAARRRADRLGVLAVSKVDFPAVVRHVTEARQHYLLQQQVPEQASARV